MTNSKVPTVLATLDLSDPDELRAHGWIVHFFGEDRQYKILDLTRAKHPPTHPDLIILVERRPAGEDAERELAVFRYQVKAISVSWLCYATYDEAHAAFQAAVAIPTWPRLMTAADAETSTAPTASRR